MVEDAYPPITMQSDVYTFGAVAMEVRFHFALRDMRGWMALSRSFSLSMSAGFDGSAPIPAQEERSWSRGGRSGRPETFSLRFHDLYRCL